MLSPFLNAACFIIRLCALQKSNTGHGKLCLISYTISSDDELWCQNKYCMCRVDFKSYWTSHSILPYIASCNEDSSSWRSHAVSQGPKPSDSFVLYGFTADIMINTAFFPFATVTTQTWQEEYCYFRLSASFLACRLSHLFLSSGDILFLSSLTISLVLPFAFITHTTSCSLFQREREREREKENSAMHTCRVRSDWCFLVAETPSLWFLILYPMVHTKISQDPHITGASLPSQFPTSHIEYFRRNRYWGV